MKLLLLLGITLTPALVILPAPRAARGHQKASVDGAGPPRASIMQEEEIYRSRSSGSFSGT